MHCISPQAWRLSRVLLLLAVLLAVGAWASNGAARAAAPAPVVLDLSSPPAVKEESFFSAALSRDMAYAVYLPPGYAASRHHRYPVLYMLHGLGGDYGEWMRLGLFTTATALIQAGEIPPLIIVAPEGKRGYWMDHANNGPRFGTYVSEDLVATIDRLYRTIPDREARAIGGMSMGGHGALQLALNHADTFGVVGAHSVALRSYEQAFEFFGDQQYFQAHDPVSLCKKDPAKARQFAIWLDIGSQDQWLGPAEAFHEQLISQKVEHDWQVFKGGHDGAYWGAHAADYLRFYGAEFETALGD